MTMPSVCGSGCPSGVPSSSARSPPPAGTISCGPSSASLGHEPARAWNPRGTGNAPRYRSASSRTTTSTRCGPSSSRNDANVGRTPANRSGISVAIARSAARTAETRRRIDRSAHTRPTGSSASGGCTTSTAAATLPTASTVATTASTASRVPDHRAARNEGKRLIDAPSRGHHQRATRTPAGTIRSYVPSLSSPQPPSGWNGQLSRVAFSHARSLTYRSSESGHFHRSCTAPTSSPRVDQTRGLTPLWASSRDPVSQAEFPTTAPGLPHRLRRLNEPRERTR